MNYEMTVFENQTITLDGNTFKDCTFISCIIEYAGGEFTLDGNTRMTGNWRVRFLGDARKTARLLLTLIGGMAGGINFGQHFDIEAPSHHEFN